MLLHYLGAFVVCMAILLNIVAIGTPHFAASNTFRPVDKDASGNYRLGVQKEIYFGLFRLCTDACIYKLPGSYECYKKYNGVTGMPMRCYNLSPDPVKELYGENGVKSPGWLIATQAIAIIGLSVTCVGGILLVAIIDACKLNKGKRNEEKFRLYSNIVAASFIVGGVITFVACIIFGTLYPRLALWDGKNDVYEDIGSAFQNGVDDQLDLDWGFWVEVAGGICSVVAGVLHFVGLCFPIEHVKGEHLAEHF